jgi:hypothetical protein
MSTRYAVTSDATVGAAGQVFRSNGIEVAWAPVAGVLRKTYAPAPAVTYSNGITVVAVFSLPNTRSSFLPSHWLIPATAGAANALQPGVRFTFSDATTVTSENNVAVDVTVQMDTVDFDKDTLAITQIEFYVNNTSGGDLAGNVSSFYIHGYVA